MFKKIIVYFILVLILGLSGCNDNITNKEIREKQKFRSDYTKTIIIQEPVFTEAEQEGIFSVKIQGLSSSNTPKEVDIPFKGLKLLIPSEKIVDDVMINPGLKEIYENKKIVLNSEIEKTLQQKINPNSKNIVDSSGKIYPGVYCSSPVIQWKAGYQILYINLYPLQYNPEKEEVYLFKEMEVSIKYEENNREDVPKSNIKELKSILKIIDNHEDYNDLEDLE
ncbi:hypothetical protein [Wukongibacter baidiensis]